MSRWHTVAGQVGRAVAPVILAAVTGLLAGLGVIAVEVVQCVGQATEVAAADRQFASSSKPSPSIRLLGRPWRLQLPH